MKRILQLFFVLLLLTSSTLVLNAKCLTYATHGAGWSVANKDCKYTFTANKMTDSSCFYFAWYKGKTLLGTGSTYTTTFNTNDSAEYKLVIKNICDTTCADTSIVKKVAYNCAPKCIWKNTKAGWSYSKKDCVYSFEATNLHDSCVTYTWLSAGKVLGTGRFLTYTFYGKDTAEICLKVKDTCKGCDTTICQKIINNCPPQCIWKDKKPGYTYGNKDCAYTFEATDLKDTCIVYKWYKGSDLIGSGRVLTYTFNSNSSSNICLKVIDTCHGCDTSICKIIQYSCGSKCDWKNTKAGWGYSKKDCVYSLEATNLNDSCVTYTWLSAGKVLGTGRLLTYTFNGRDTVEICLKLKDTCKGCDTTICQKIINNCPPKCIWKDRKPGYTYANKDCVYTFEATNLHDSCVKYKWYKDNVYLSSGRILTYTFKSNSSSNICLKVIDACRNCDTAICKTIQYSCGSKCDWKNTKAGWGYTKSGCDYKLEATNLHDSCVTYTWISGGKILGIGRLLTYTFNGKDTAAEICLKLKDTCKGCDTTICKKLIKPCTSGLGKSLNDQSGVKIYPNPSNSGFEIEKAESETIIIKMFDLLGTMVNAPQTANGTSIFIDTKTLSNGVYFLQINRSSTMITQKIVVQH